MRPDSKIFVAGHRGLAGSALVRKLNARGYSNIVVRTHSDLDLANGDAVKGFLESERPEYIFLAAARVGGIVANNTYPAEFIHDNLAIQTNVIHQAWKVGVRRLLFMGSSCIYPRECPQPIREEYLMTGQLESTNRPYAIAKIAGIEMCWSYNRQYGTEFLAVMPTNLYGAGDNYDLQNSHVLPALIRKFHEAKVSDASEVSVWGTGNPRREFLHSDDMADACVFLMGMDQENFQHMVDPSAVPLVNVGCGEDLSIRELADLVCQVTGYKGKIAWDRSKPDGTPKKLLDVSRLANLGWRATVSLEQGIAMAYADFLSSRG